MPFAAALLTILSLAAATASAGCSDAEAGATKDRDTADTATGCPPMRQREQGGCCPTGTHYVFARDACEAVGPPACADVLPGEPGACVPRWCAERRDEEGKPCAPGDPRCWVQARSCTPAEITAGGGCPAGEWPRQDGACGRPGRGSATGSARVSDDKAMYGLPPCPPCPSRQRRPGAGPARPISPATSRPTTAACARALAPPRRSPKARDVPPERPRMSVPRARWTVAKQAWRGPARRGL